MSTLESNIQQVFDNLLPKILARHQESSQPVFLGITGLQGSGKSTWAASVVELLRSHRLDTLAISLDDLYKTHDGLIAQRVRHPGNKLYHTRGQPGTHDEQLAAQFFKDIRGQKFPLSVPSFDKSKFNGGGDRAPPSHWPMINSQPDVIVFEGWCVGFQPLTAFEVEQRLNQALVLSINSLAKHPLKHLLELNENLKNYCSAFMGPQHFDFIIHIDTDNLRNVYTWRLQQEHRLIKEKGIGMTDEEVVAFIEGYMPGYELYLDKLRGGFFNERGRQVRVLLDKERRIESLEEL